MMMFNKMKKILSIALGLTMMFTLTACGEDSDTGGGGGGSGTGDVDLSTKGNTVDEVKLENGDTYAIISIKDFGDIKLKLFPEIAPLAVNNFIKLTNDGYYNGLTFHRIINNFMIQGGCFIGNGTGSHPDYSEFATEPSPYAVHVYGAISTANRGPGTNGQQFFIVNTQQTPHLNGRHTVFGQTVEGFDVLDAVSKVQTDANDKPRTDVIIEKVVVGTFEG
jgi:cyclophilin family peptidyl-prolyl cis-trans isomerase